MDGFKAADSLGLRLRFLHHVIER
uniref:Uncharacterized protein n=1 Tax=Rhizophora mucronata TaxID=61149 RepID=A0A2P2JC39_RHIMU